MGLEDAGFPFVQWSLFLNLKCFWWFWKLYNIWVVWYLFCRISLIWDFYVYVYIYLYLEPKSPLSFKINPTKQGLNSNQKKRPHLGSRYPPENDHISFFQRALLSRWFSLFPEVGYVSSFSSQKKVSISHRIPVGRTVYLPIHENHKKSTIHVGKYTVRPMGILWDIACWFPDPKPPWKNPP